MRPKAIAPVLMFMICATLLTAGQVIADDPPEITMGQEYIGSEGWPVTFDDVEITDKESNILYLDITWDFDDKTDEDLDGVMDNDDESSMEKPVHIFMDPGIYVVTVTVVDESSNKVTKKANVTIAPSGEVYEITGGGSIDDLGRSVAKNGWIAYLSHMKRDRMMSITVTPGNGTAGLAFVAITSDTFENFQAGVIPYTIIKAYSKAIDKQGTTFEFTAVATEDVYLVIINHKRIDGIPATYTTTVGDSPMTYDLKVDAKDQTTPTPDYLPAILIMVIGLVVVAVMGVVIYKLSTRPKVRKVSVFEASPQEAELTPEQKMWKEWRDYEVMYGVKHPNSPYSLIQAERQQKEQSKPKYQSMPCPNCGETTSYDNYSRTNYCYKCKKNVEIAVPGRGPPPQGQGPFARAPPPQGQPPPPGAHPPPPKAVPPPRPASAIATAHAKPVPPPKPGPGQ